EPSEPAVAEPRFFLARQNLVQVLAELAHRPSRRLLEIEIQQVVAEMRPEQELRGQIAREFPPLRDVGLGRALPVVLHAIADGERERVVVVVAARRGGPPPDGVAKMILDGLPQRLGPAARTDFVAGLRHSGQTQSAISGRSAPCSCAYCMWSIIAFFISS